MHLNEEKAEKVGGCKRLEVISGTTHKQSAFFHIFFFFFFCSLFSFSFLCGNRGFGVFFFLCFSFFSFCLCLPSTDDLELVGEGLLAVATNFLGELLSVTLTLEDLIHACLCFLPTDKKKKKNPETNCD